MANGTTAVHVTHEAISKVGGIGAVLQGFFTSKSYNEAIGRSILVGPLFASEGSLAERLGPDGEVLYSSIDGLINTEYSPAFHRIESQYNVGIVYGRRSFTDAHTGIKSSPEVILIDVRHMDNDILNAFKRRLFEEFGIQSHLYEKLWEYEQYIRLGPAAIAILKVIGAAQESTAIISHEFMGMPTVLAAILEPDCDSTTVFYAHEVATMRRIVEDHPGHDTMFYNVMNQAHQEGLYVNEVFGDQSTFFKHGLVEASKYCDKVLAVGDYVVNELRFLAPEFTSKPIDIVYNGIPAYEISLEEKQTAKAKLQTYCKTLLGYCPDYIFTHVTRLVKSKGLWRDLCILSTLEQEFRQKNKTGVFVLLSTDVAQRRTQDIQHMESTYAWPVAHREGWPDLSGGEADFYAQIQRFNAKSRHIKVVFINQFGFDPKTCGTAMPEDMEFIDIRKASDVEFGLSTYEPFGIAQLEPLTFGGICVFSSVCGCAGFLRDVSQGQDIKNAIIADYTEAGFPERADIEDLLQINTQTRDHTEARVSHRVAQDILARLPQNDADVEDLIRRGYALAKNMSWDVVTRQYLLATLQDAWQNVGVG
jgi:hypothetical protein